MSVCNYFTCQLMLALVPTRTQRSGTRTQRAVLDERRSATHRVEYEYRPGGLSMRTQLHNAKLIGRFRLTDETSDRQSLIAGSTAYRLYSKPCAGFSKNIGNQALHYGLRRSLD